VVKLRPARHPQSGQTIGQHFEGMTTVPETLSTSFRFRVTVEELVKAVSSGRFHSRALQSYEHTDALAECCRDAILELSAQSFRGRASCIRLMGRSMEILRERHNLNVPPGWIIVLRELRADKSLDFSDPLFETPAPTDLFEGGSAFSCYRDELKPFESLLADVGKGAVPRSCVEAGMFLDAVSRTLLDRGEIVPDGLQKVRKHLRERDLNTNFGHHTGG
jgi:hypothetical protein